MSLLRIPVERLAEHGRGRPPAFLHAVAQQARVVDGCYEISSREWLDLVGLHSSRPKAHPVEPTLVELAGNFSQALSRWRAEGYKVVSREAYDVRSATCDGCKHWEPSARLGLGKCNHPGCGCTKFKRWLVTERCPLGLWPELKPEITMDIEALKKRRAAFQTRLAQLTDQIAVTDGRAKSLRQQQQLAIGNIQALTQVIESEEKIPSEQQPS